MKYYHATDHKIDWPDPLAHHRYADPTITGNRVLGLFSNSEPEGSHVFGARLYSFTLRRSAKILEIPDEIYQVGRCVAFYHGVRDLAEHMGFDALQITHSPAVISLVVMNFSAIKTWEYEGESL